MWNGKRNTKIGEVKVVCECLNIETCEIVSWETTLNDGQMMGNADGRTKWINKPKDKGLWVRRKERTIEDYFNIFSILSSATSTPLINRVTCRGSSRSFRFSSPYSNACCSCIAFSKATGRLRVILVSWMVSRERPMTSK